MRKIDFKLKATGKKILFGVAVSMVLAMAIGSFALGENQTPASPRAVEAQSAVGATAGPFTVEGGTEGVDYSYTSPVLTIHSGDLTVSTSAQTAERIVVDGAATITLAGVNIDRSSITTTEPAALAIIENANFDVKILLADSTTNILKGAAGNSSTSPYPAGSPGIEKNGEGDNIGTLTIGVPDGSAGTGKLEATGGYEAAGIGGGGSENGSNITISGGVVTATGGEGAAGIGGGSSENGSNITISGGKVTANGGENGSGIGGGYYSDGSNITISGGEIIATGGKYGAGIGGGYQGEADGITISGGEVTANGGEGAAGIGGGSFKSGSSITISGGVVTATGGKYAAGIGSGYPGSGSVNNILNGDAVVLATSGDTSKAALEGFDSLLTKGIAFTGLGTAFDDKGRATDVTWDSNGTMYGDVTLSQDLEIPANLTVPAGQILSIKEDKDVTLSEETGAKYTIQGELRNNGTVTLPSDLAFSGNGKVTTKTDFYREGSTDVYATGYQTYQTSAGVQKYTNLPNPDQTNANGFVNWYYIDQDGKKIKIDENSFVTLNAHSFYENLYSISIAKQGEGEITPNVTEAAKDDTVTLTVTPDEGYQLKEGSLIVTDADGNEVPVTEQDGKYTFTMPGADVTVNAAFELIPEPTVDPGVKTGDSFAGIATLAILGLATTGAALLRKRK